MTVKEMMVECNKLFDKLSDCVFIDVNEGDRIIADFKNSLDQTVQQIESGELNLDRELNDVEKMALLRGKMMIRTIMKDKTLVKIRGKE